MFVSKRGSAGRALRPILLLQRFRAVCLRHSLLFQHAPARPLGAPSESPSWSQRNSSIDRAVCPTVSRSCCCCRDTENLRGAFEGHSSSWAKRATEGFTAKGWAQLTQARAAALPLFADKTSQRGPFPPLNAVAARFPLNAVAARFPLNAVADRSFALIGTDLSRRWARGMDFNPQRR